MFLCLYTRKLHQSTCSGAHYPGKRSIQSYKKLSFLMSYCHTIILLMQSLTYIHVHTCMYMYKCRKFCISHQLSGTTVSMSRNTRTVLLLILQKKLPDHHKMNFSLLKYVDPEEGGGKDSKDKKRFATELAPLLSHCKLNLL